MMAQPQRNVSRDVVIVGAGVGGLALAILLQSRGHRVTVLEKNTRVGGRANLIEQDDFRFDTGPSLINYPWVFRELFESAGLRLDDYVTLVPVDPSVRFKWPDGTSLMLSSDVQQLQAAFEGLEPGCAPRLLDFLADSETKYNFSFNKLVRNNATNPLVWFGAMSPREMLKSSVWRSLYRQLSGYFRSPRICEALGSYGMYLGGSPWDLPGLFSILAYGELAYGLWLPKGGVYALVAGMERAARTLGVDVRLEQDVRHIRMTGRRVTGVELADGSVLDAPTVVSNVDVPTTQASLLDRRRIKRPRMTPGVVTFYWGVRGNMDPLGHHTIFLPDKVKDGYRDLFKRRRIPRELPFYISVASDTDPSLAPCGHSTVFALVPTPVLSELGEVNWQDVVHDLRTTLLDRLRRHGVDLDDDRLVHETVLTPADWAERFGLYDGSAFGATHSLFQLGPFRAPNAEPGIDGLYYVGAGTTPGTGLPMVALGAFMTAERIEASAR